MHTFPYHYLDCRSLYKTKISDTKNTTDNTTKTPLADTGKFDTECICIT